VAERLQCEFSLIRYVPDVVKGEFANIGVVLRPALRPGLREDASRAGGAAVRFTRDWGRVRCQDPDADVELLESLETEIAALLEREAAAESAAESASESKAQTRPLLSVLEDSLSNSVQLTAMRGTLAESLPAEMEQLLKLYVEPLKAPAARKKQAGRTAIAASMRQAFEQAGVWRLMRKKIAAAQYTQAGDPLRLDCGYRNGNVKMFHAVSLAGDAEGAKGLAYSAAALREGVERSEGVALQLTAVVEPIATVSDEELYRFGVRAMERVEVRVLTVADLGRAAETARRELRV
jgi:hypothetical protein